MRFKVARLGVLGGLPLTALMVLVAGCGTEELSQSGTEWNSDEAADTALMAPVALNANSPVEYPPELLRRGIEATVLLQLYIDATGTVHQESTRVAQSSGFPALDSAALAAAPELRFAPALRNDEPVATTFLLPIDFRRPEPGAGT